MKRSEIHISVELDDNNIPDKIHWMATDGNPEGKVEETKAVAIAIWDHENKNTLKLDLWNKEMQVEEMKKFCIEMMVGISETLRTATGDEGMVGDISDLCKKFRHNIDQGNTTQ